MKRASLFSTTLHRTLLALVAISTSANAAVLVSENFDSYVDGLIDGQGFAIDGWSGPWGGSADVLGGQLSFPSFELDAYRDVDAISAPNVGESYYYAFDLTVTQTPSGIYGNALPSGGSGTYWAIGQSNDNFEINGPEGPGGTIVAGETYRIVTRGTRFDATPDIVDVWINPSSESDTPLFTWNSESDIIGLSTSISQFQFSWDNNSAGDVFIDNFSITTTFQEAAVAAPVPEPSSSLLIVGAGAMLLMRRSRGWAR